MAQYIKKYKPALWKQIADKKNPPLPKARPQPIARRVRVRQVSKKRRKESKVYSAKRIIFLQEHPDCQACKVWNAFSNSNKSEDVHHTRGRAGTLYLDERFWLAVCRPCHLRIENEKSKAIELVLIGPWGKQEP